MNIHASHVIKRTTRGENTSEALRSVGKAKPKGAKIARVQSKIETQTSVISREVGLPDHMKRARAINQRNERRAKRAR